MKYLLELDRNVDGDWDYTLFRWEKPLAGLNANGVYKHMDGGIIEYEHFPQYNEAIREIRLYHNIGEEDELIMIEY